MLIAEWFIIVVYILCLFSIELQSVGGCLSNDGIEFVCSDCGEISLFVCVIMQGVATSLHQVVEARRILRDWDNSNERGVLGRIFAMRKEGILGNNSYSESGEM
jgi:hypothetical protein